MHDRADPEDDRRRHAGSFSATFTATPTAGNMLIAIAGTRINGTMTAPAGWSTAINETATPAPQAAIFYKLAGASEPTTVTVTTDATGNGNGIHLFEYRCVTTLDLASSDDRVDQGGVVRLGDDHATRRR